MVKLIKNYFHNTTTYSAERFIVEMFLIIFVLKNLFSVSASILNNYIDVNIITGIEEREEFLMKYNWFISFFIVCVIAPIVETITAQAIPIIIASKFFKKRIILVIISASFFSIFHSSYSFLLIIYIFIAGIIYAWSFIVYRNEGCFAACFVTAIIHSLSNFFPFLNLYFFQL